MDYTATNRPTGQKHLKQAGQILASTLFLGLLSPLVPSAIAQTPAETTPTQTIPAPTTPAPITPAPTTPAPTTPAPTTPSQSQPNEPESPVAQRLYGQWVAKDSQGKSLLMFIFTPTGKLYIMQPPEEQQPLQAVEMGYKINSTPKPMHLDVQINTTQTVLTVFDFTSDGKMRLQLEGTNPGEKRPTELKENAANFEKISDNSTLPPNTKIMNSNQ